MNSEQAPGGEPGSNQFSVDAERDQLPPGHHAMLLFRELADGLSMFLPR